MAAGDEAVQACKLDRYGPQEEERGKKQLYSQDQINLGMQTILMGIPQRLFRLVWLLFCIPHQAEQRQELQAAVQAGWEALPPPEGRENSDVFKAAFGRAGKPVLVPCDKQG